MFQRVLTNAPCLTKGVRYFIFYSLKKPEPMFIISGKQYPNNRSF